jgi:hypothetical protein
MRLVGGALLAVLTVLGANAVAGTSWSLPFGAAVIGGLLAFDLRAGTR